MEALYLSWAGSKLFLSGNVGPSYILKRGGLEIGMV